MLDFVKDVVHPVHILKSKITGFRREGSQLFVDCGSFQPQVVSYTTLEAAEKGEAWLKGELEQ